MEKYLKVSVISWINTLEYRLDLFFDLISKFFPAMIQYFMWTAIFNNAPNDIIMNYTYHQMILYTVISIFVSTLLSVNIHWGIAQDIKNGTLSKYLILPVSYLFYKVFQFIGSKLSDSILVGFSLFLVIILFQVKKVIAINLPLAGIFLLVAVMALILQFLIYYCISGIAFWIGDCGGIFTVVNVIASIISGAVFPLDIFGEPIVKISQLFPFYYITYFPTNVILGKATEGEMVKAIVMIGLWILVLTFFMRFIWKKGMKRYIAAGG